MADDELAHHDHVANPRRRPRRQAAVAAVTSMAAALDGKDYEDAYAKRVKSGMRKSKSEDSAKFRRTGSAMDQGMDSVASSSDTIPPAKAKLRLPKSSVGKNLIQCANRECIEPAGQIDRPRSIYCSKRCQAREQNLRQRRVAVRPVAQVRAAAASAVTTTTTTVSMPTKSERIRADSGGEKPKPHVLSSSSSATRSRFRRISIQDAATLPLNIVSAPVSPSMSMTPYLQFMLTPEAPHLGLGAGGGGAPSGARTPATAPLPGSASSAGLYSLAAAAEFHVPTHGNGHSKSHGNGHGRGYSLDQGRRRHAQVQVQFAQGHAVPMSVAHRSASQASQPQSDPMASPTGATLVDLSEAASLLSSMPTSATAGSYPHRFPFPHDRHKYWTGSGSVSTSSIPMLPRSQSLLFDTDKAYRERRPSGSGPPASPDGPD